MRIALIQMPVTADKRRNIETACGKIREAAGKGTDFAVLPEMFCSPYQNDCFRSWRPRRIVKARVSFRRCIRIAA